MLILEGKLPRGAFRDARTDPAEPIYLIGSMTDTCIHPLNGKHENYWVLCFVDENGIRLLIEKTKGRDG